MLILLYTSIITQVFKNLCDVLRSRQDSCYRTSSFLDELGAGIVIDCRTDFLKALLFKINFVTVLILLGARSYRKLFVGVKCLNKGKKETGWKIGATC